MGALELDTAASSEPIARVADGPTRTRLNDRSAFDARYVTL